MKDGRKLLLKFLFVCPTWISSFFRLIDWLNDGRQIFVFVFVCHYSDDDDNLQKQTNNGKLSAAAANFHNVNDFSMFDFSFLKFIRKKSEMNEYLKSRNSWNYHQRFLWVIKVNCNQIKSIDWFNQFDRSRMSTNCLIDFSDFSLVLSFCFYFFFWNQYDRNLCVWQ